MIKNLVTLHRAGHVYQWSTDKVTIEPNHIEFNIDGAAHGFEVKDTDDWSIVAVETVEAVTGCPSCASDNWYEYQEDDTFYIVKCRACGFEAGPEVFHNIK